MQQQEKIQTVISLINEGFISFSDIREAEIETDVSNLRYEELIDMYCQSKQYDRDYEEAIEWDLRKPNIQGYFEKNKDVLDFLIENYG